MDPSAIIKAVPAPQMEPGKQPALQFRPGDRLAGKVLQVENDGRVLVDLGGPRVLARMGFDVHQGQALKLTVVETGPPLHLRVLEKGPPLLLRSDAPAEGIQRQSGRQDDMVSGLTGTQRRQLQDTLAALLSRQTARASTPPAMRAVVSALSRLQVLLEPVPMQKSAADIAQWLRQALENSGGLFEKRLADVEKGEGLPSGKAVPMPARDKETPARTVIARDLKPQLLILKNFLNGADPDPATALKADARQLGRLGAAVEKMVQHLEQQQQRLLTRGGENEPFQVFSQALPMEEQRPPVQFKVYYPRKERQEKGDASHRIALLLDMDRLGPVSGEISRTVDGVQIQFYVRDRDVRDLFDAASRQIVAALKGRFNHVRVAVAVAPEKIARFHDEDVPDTARGRIDIKA